MSNSAENISENNLITASFVVLGSYYWPPTERETGNYFFSCNPSIWEVCRQASNNTTVLSFKFTKKAFIFTNFAILVVDSLIWKFASITVWHSVQTWCAYLCMHHTSTSSLLQELRLHVLMHQCHSTKSLTGLFSLCPRGSSLEFPRNKIRQWGCRRIQTAHFFLANCRKCNNLQWFRDNLGSSI